MLLREILREEKTQWTARKVVADILGDLAWFGDAEKTPPGKFAVMRTWDYNGRPVFCDFDAKPGQGGAIGLVHVDGSTPADIAEAAHETFHALLHSRFKNFHNNHLVNKLAMSWLKKNLDEEDFHKARETIMKSKLSYQNYKYVPTRTWGRTGKITK
jgi:hypothetical protein